MDRHDYEGLIKHKMEQQAHRSAKYKSDSRDRLASICKKKITTTMVGALDSIERHFGFLWDEQSDGDPEASKMMKDLYDKVREEILDNGNNQSRNLAIEIEQYEVQWLRYQMQLPVKHVNEDKENNG